MRATPIVAAVAGGVLYFLGYIGWGVWPCIFVFLVPLWCGLDAVAHEGLGRTLVLGLVFGLAAYAGGFSWLWYLVDAFLEGSRTAGAALWLAYGLWFAAGFAVYAAAFRAIRRRGWSVATAGVPSLVVLEWLQPALFPVNAGTALMPVPLFVQTADLGGPLLLTALAGGANVACFETWAWWRGRRSRPLGTWLAAVATAFAVFGYGVVRTADVERAAAAAPAFTVGLVQPNLGVMEKRTQSVRTHEAHVILTRELLAAGPVDLVVWPETAYVRGLRRPLPLSGRPVLQDLAVPLLFGGSSVREEDGRRLATNSALLVGADGMIRDVYDKNLLIPFAEYVPMAGLVPGLARLFPHVQAFDASTDTPALHLGSWRLATPICYEVARPDFVRRMVRTSRPHVLVALANDAWFGDSQEPWIHLALARLRAVEHRRFLVRATNSGVSAIVDPNGRTVARTDLLARATLRGTVRVLEGETVYARWGDWVGWVSLAFVVLAFAVRR
ncbi:MAG TPA: apolipoprotein N-acyltransferase [Candidatus Eisenbacteria bacterium]|nr:apolipoprotein N-acyltransferase [Candidatus Eisenbacteria bacterium]